MASLTSAAVGIPSFTGVLKARSSSSLQQPKSVPRRSVVVGAHRPPRASLRDHDQVGRARAAALVAATAAASAALMAGNALAAEVLLGASDGSLAFVPSELSVASGEQITFKNNAGFPHNVVFDEDEIPSGVDASAISMKEEDLLNAPGETFTVTLKAKGTYTFYCSPHQGAGMVGKITVN